MDNGRDLIFEALFECWVGGVYSTERARTMTRTQRGRINQAVRELVEIDASPDDVRSRWQALRKQWPNLTITPQALLAHWSTLAGQSRASTADEWLSRNRRS